MAFPSILLAIAIMASLGPSDVQRLRRARRGLHADHRAAGALDHARHRQQPFVESARAIGMEDRAILFRYIYPNGLSPLIVQCTFVVAFAIISEASLSFLGAGVDPETPTWGNMLRDGQRLLQRDWRLTIFPRRRAGADRAFAQSARRRPARRPRPARPKAVSGCVGAYVGTPCGDRDVWWHGPTVVGAHGCALRTDRVGLGRCGRPVSTAAFDPEPTRTRSIIDMRSIGQARRRCPYERSAPLQSRGIAAICDRGRWSGTWRRPYDGVAPDGE